jgi:diguanylate cyclase (GGDEF)-like protein
LRSQSSSKVWACLAVCLVIAQVIASLLLPKSYRLAAISDWICFFLLALATVAFSRNASRSNHRQRLVWILLGVGYGVELFGQILWMRWELVWKQTPAMYFGDACTFLAWTLLILGLALRPHAEPIQQNRRLGTLDLLLLLLAWIYLYVFLVIPWQYLTPDPAAYNQAYKFLALAQDVVLLSIVILGIRQSSGQWRRFYILLAATVAFDTIMEYVVDTMDTYFSGGWYDSMTAIGLAGIIFAALMIHGEESTVEHGDKDSERYWLWASRLAVPVTLFLPLLAAWSFLDHTLPAPVWKFRVLLTLAATVLIAFVGIVKQGSLEKELANANQELLDASVTDLLTGVRNRRFFCNSIDADVQQVFRSLTNPASTDNRNRDLVFYLIDVDHFKRVNDQFGHQVGDRVLVEVARRISSASRLSDAVIRWGGEEFLLLSRYTDRKEADVLGKRVLEAVGSKPCRVEGSTEEIYLTCSIGWAAFPWVEAEPMQVFYEQVLVLADYALYEAKGSGRNRAVGLIPASEAMRNAPGASPIYVNGIPAYPVTTLGSVCGPMIGAAARAGS